MKIQGYRELTIEQIQLMNEIKCHGELFRDSFLSKLEALVEDEDDRINLQKAIGDIRSGYMMAVRVITKPATFA